MTIDYKVARRFRDTLLEERTRLNTTGGFFGNYVKRPRDITGEWRDAFAWLPVTTIGGKLRWLCPVMVRDRLAVFQEYDYEMGCSFWTGEVFVRDYEERKK